MTAQQNQADERGPRWLEYMRVDRLKGALVNPKGHIGEMIAESMAVHGYIEPLTLDERTKRLVSGHGRRDELIEMRRAGAEPPDGITVDGRGNWLVPVTRGWRSADDDQAHAAGVLINRATMAGAFRDDELGPLLEQLQARPAGLEGTGFDDGDVARLLAQLGPADPGPVPERKPRTRQINPVVCPSCGAEFHPAPAS